MPKIGNKAFDSVIWRAYKPAPRRGDDKPASRGCLRVGLIFDIVDREKGCVGGGPGKRCLLDPGANASNYVVAAAKQRQPLRVCVWDPNVVRSTRSARAEKNGRG